MRRRALPSVDELLAALEEHGVADAPREGPDEESLRGLLDMALWAADLRKEVSFPGFHWSDPGFVARDAKATLRFAYAALPGATPDALAWALEGNLPRFAGEGMTLLALDAHATQAREYEVAHRLYGEVTLFSFPHRPAEPADPRIHEARERGWTRVLKENNLLPGRGIVVLDEHQGLLLTDDRLRELPGVLLLLPDGHTSLLWNPFARAEKNDPELQYWPAWGPGTAPTEWREVLRVGEPEE